MPAGCKCEIYPAERNLSYWEILEERSDLKPASRDLSLIQFGNPFGVEIL
jgi:hypothetical protein